MIPSNGCRQCYNTTFHFDSRRHAIVCDVCGAIQNITEMASAQLQYDRDRQKAIAFIKACDYTSAKPFLERMNSQQPDDSDIYYLHLMGLTDCCRDLLLKDSDAGKLNEAKRYWEILCSLDGDKRAFLQFGQKRNTALTEIHRKTRNKAVIELSICLSVLLISVILILIGFWVAVIGIVISVYFIVVHHLISTAINDTCSAEQNSSSPFGG